MIPFYIAVDVLEYLDEKTREVLQLVARVFLRASHIVEANKISSLRNGYDLIIAVEGNDIICNLLYLENTRVPETFRPFQLRPPAPPSKSTTL